MGDEANVNPKVQSAGGGDDSGKIRRTAVGSGGGDEYDPNKWFFCESESYAASRIAWVITYAIESLGHALGEIPQANNYCGLAEVAESHFRKGWGSGEKDLFGNLAPKAVELVIGAFCVIEAGYDDNILKQTFPSFSQQQFNHLKWLVNKYAKPFS